MTRFPTRLRRLGAIALIVGVQSRAVIAQEKSDSLFSKVLGEVRHLRVYLPAGYDTASGRKYDVVYVLDGEMLGRFLPPIAAFEESNELMPPVIAVGIDNGYVPAAGQSSRERDLLPVHVEDSPLSGGADAFARFLEDELLPFIGRGYRTSGKNILFGHSYGGLFAVYLLLTHPTLFDSYIASDPSLWWNRGYVDSLAARRLGRIPNTRRTLYLGGRSGRIWEAFGIRAMDSLLRAAAPPNLRWRTEAYPDEHHGSVRFKNMYDGLKFTYFGYSPFVLDYFPRQGVLLPNRPARLFLYSTYLGYSPGIRYTTDGSEPTSTSARYDFGTAVSAPASVTLKLFANYGADRSVRGRFTLGRVVPPSPLPSGVVAGGLGFSSYEGSWDSTPNLAALTPKETGKARSGVDLSGLHRSGQTAYVLEGYLQTERAGYYTFFLEADGVARLSVGGKRVLDIDVARDRERSSSYIVPLAKGFYPVRLEYFHATGEPTLSWQYLPAQPGDDGPLARLPVDIPVRLLYAKP